MIPTLGQTTAVAVAVAGLTAWCGAGVAVAAGDEVSVPDVLKSVTPDELSRLRHDGVLVREPAFVPGMTFGALMTVAQGARATFEMLAQPSKQACYLTEVAKSLSVERGPSTEVVEFEVKKFGTSRYRVVHRFDRDRLHIEWTLDPNFDNDLRTLRGYFTVWAVDEKHALVEYGTAVDAKRWLPDFIQRRAMRSDVPAALRRLRAFLESGGRCDAAAKNG
jgi:hypothetical protein